MLREYLIEWHFNETVSSHSAITGLDGIEGNMKTQIFGALK
jgi:hypothetical protein